jgi:putative cardiolipin synthase
MRRLVLAALLLIVGGCASLPADYERTESHALADTASTSLGRNGREALAAHPGESAFRPLTDGVDALVARMLLAEAAERSLDVQYYIWHDDLTGRLFGNALLRAADRGVRVRILLDDVGTKANDEVVLALDSHPNVEVRLFNPVASRAFRGLGMLTDFSRVNRRMHNKVFVADNQRAILGGRNIGDEYFDAHGGVVFSDVDVEIAGPAVAEASKAFDAYWNAPMSVPIAALTGGAGRPRASTRCASSSPRSSRRSATAPTCAAPVRRAPSAWPPDRRAGTGAARSSSSTIRPR